MRRNKKGAARSAENIKSRYGYEPGELKRLKLNDKETGNNLRRLMETHDHNVIELARVLGVSKRLVYRWLEGTLGIRPEYFLRLMAIYDVAFWELYGFDIVDE